MKKVLLILLLPIIVFGQSYMEVKMYPKSPTSGNATLFMGCDTVVSNWLSLSPGDYEFGMQTSVPTTATMYTMQNWNFLSPATPFPTIASVYDSAMIVEYANGSLLDIQEPYLVGTLNQTIIGKVVKIMVIFTGQEETRTNNRYKVFYIKESNTSP